MPHMADSTRNLLISTQAQSSPGDPPWNHSKLSSGSDGRMQRLHPDVAFSGRLSVPYNSVAVRQHPVKIPAFATFRSQNCAIDRFPQSTGVFDLKKSLREQCLLNTRNITCRLSSAFPAEFAAQRIPHQMPGISPLLRTVADRVLKEDYGILPFRHFSPDGQYTS